MREILFSGKQCGNEKWVEGYLMDENYINAPFNDDEVCGRFDEPIEVDPSTVCQYTGYMDLRKKKAFEHHIVFCEDNQATGQIVYKEGQFLIEWGESRPDLRRDIHFWFTQRRMYIIGNIFDNPELMEAN